MRLQKIKLFVFIIMASFVLILGIHLYDRIIHCTENGLSRSEALKIAEKKLKIDFQDNDFTFKKEKYEAYDSIWIFTYQANDCIVDVIIDNCGASDIGGLSEGCIPRQR